MKFLLNFLKRRRLAQAKADANEAWLNARNAYRNAKARGDTRGQHEARLTVSARLHDVLRLEVGR